jgi:hypothetical protein
MRRPALVLGTLASLVLALPAARAEEGWSHDLDAALARAKKEQKPLVVDLSKPG